MQYAQLFKKLAQNLSKVETLQYIVTLLVDLLTVRWPMLAVQTRHHNVFPQLTGRIALPPRPPNSSAANLRMATGGSGAD